MYQGKMVKTADLKTIQDLEKMKRRFDKMIKDISESENPTTEDMTNKSKYSIISKDLEKLINTRTNNDAKVSDEITADEYNNFVDNGIVKAGRITKIAEKVKNGTDLTQQEKEMFQDKTTEINEELRKMSEKEAAKAKPSDTEAKKADIERRRQEALSSIISEINVEENRRPNGSIGTQGFTSENLNSLVDFLNKELSLNIPSSLLNQDSLKPLIEYIKSDKKLISKIYDYIKTDPVEVNYLPDGTIHFQDGNHRANLLNLIGSENIPVIEVGQRSEIDKINSEYDAELAALEKMADTIPENPESSDDVDSPTQDPESRKVEVIDDAKRYSINDFKADLAKVQTIEELQQILADLNIKVSEESVAFEDLQVMSELAKQKAADIKAGTVKIDPIGLTEGAQLIAKEIIFDGANMFAMTNESLVVKSVDKTNKTVTVTLMGTTDEMTVGFDKLNEMFILKDTVMNASEPVTEPVTNEEKEMVTQSSDLADAILNNSIELEKLEKSVSNKTVSELDTDLLEDLKC
jgi:hypothetical protein